MAELLPSASDGEDTSSRAGLLQKNYQPVQRQMNGNNTFNANQLNHAASSLNLGGGFTTDTVSFAAHMWHNAPLVNHMHDIGVGELCFAPNSKVMILRDFVIVVAVAWVMLVVPVEFATEEVSSNIAFSCIDYIVDLVFLLDLPLQFFVAYDEFTPSGIHHVYDRKKIRRHYTRRRLPADVLCAIPFRLLDVHTNLMQTYHKRCRFLKLARALRFIKLKSVRNLMRLDMEFAFVKAFQIGCIAILSAHWFACIWLSLTILQNEDETWAHALVSSKVGLMEHHLNDAFELYCWSMYFSTTLITTVGFGDITPQTSFECKVSIIFIIMGSICWAFILSSLLDLISNLDPHRINFENVLDELNHMMKTHGLPEALRHAVRTYFFECEELWKLQARSTVVEKMSPALQGQTTLALCRQWVDKVPYFHEILQRSEEFPSSIAFIIEVSQVLVQKIYPRREAIMEVAFYIIQKGSVASGNRILTAGDVCGEDFILINPKNRLSTIPLVITTCSMLQITPASLLDIMRRFPIQRKIIRRHLAWVATRRGLARELRALGAKIKGDEKASDDIRDQVAIPSSKSDTNFPDGVSNDTNQTLGMEAAEHVVNSLRGEMSEMRKEMRETRKEMLEQVKALEALIRSQGQQ